MKNSVDSNQLASDEFSRSRVNAIIARTCWWAEAENKGLKNVVMVYINMKEMKSRIICKCYFGLDIS